eukprot:s8495_g2.t1
MTELMKFESQVAKKYLELKVPSVASKPLVLKGLQFYDEQLRVLTFQKEHHHRYFNAFGAGKGDKGDKGKGKRGRRAKETKERAKETKEKAKVNELTKSTREREGQVEGFLGTCQEQGQED